MRHAGRSLAGALLALLLAPVASWAQPVPVGPDLDRPPGTRTRTAEEARRYSTGPDELQPAIERPPGFRELGAAEAEAMLRELREALSEERSLESLRPGLEDYRAVMARLERAVAASGGALRLETIGTVHGLPVKAVRAVGAPPAPDGGIRPRVLILGGVHAGTEKAGFESATRFVEAAAKDPALRARFDLTFVPLVNPTALVLGTRENARGVDINRTFEEGRTQPESRVLMEWSRGKTFDMALDLHTAGDPGRDGFFLIRAKPDGGLGARMMSALPSAALLDAPGAPGEARVGPYLLYGVGLSEIESIRGTTMDLLVRAGTPYAYVFEAPTRADPKVQVDLTLRFLRSALHNARAYGRFERPALAREEARPEEARAERGPAEPARAAEPAAPEVDPALLDPYRRADGTLDWGRLTRARVLPEVGGLAHFGLALFLKEVAVVAATGDRVRIEEFFDGLLTTDFYAQYGLFVAGARVGEVAYVKTLQRYVRPRFVNGLLKTNLALAAGLALPSIVDGSFTGRSFAISLASLGLSTAAVRTGVAGIRWVVELKQARRAGLLARIGASRFARAGGWFYTAAELAVVLYLAEELEQLADERLALAESRAAVAAAARALIAAANDPAATPEALRAQAARHAAAWAEHRNFLYAPLQRDEALLAARLERLADRAKVLGDERAAALARLADHPALRANVERRHGSLEAYAAARASADEAELQGDLEGALAAYERDRAAHLAEIYGEGRRETPLLAVVEHRDWLLAGGAAGAPGDPYGERADLFARWGRSRARGHLDDALGAASRNRLQAYDDERELLSALARGQRARGRGDLAQVLEDAAARASAVQEADRRLFDETTREGLIDRLREAAPAGR